VLNCLLAEWLLTQRYRYTLSVFLAESGSSTLPRLGRADLLRLVGVLPESRVHALLMSGGSKRSSGSSGDDSQDQEPRSSSSPDVSLAEAMVDALGLLGGHVSTHAACCQTDGPGRGGGGSAIGAISSQQLMQRLQAIEEEYRRKSSCLEQAAAQSLDERVAACQRECEARYAAQLAEQLAAARQSEAAAAREQEAGVWRQRLQEDRTKLEVEHQARLDHLNKRVGNMLPQC
jgi:hypothetical protein